MFFEQNQPEIQSDLDYSMAHRLHQKKILSFLRITLPECAKKLAGAETVSLATQKEDSISGQIVNLLNDELRKASGYIFRFESKKGPDILIYAVPYQPFSTELFIVEAKRLPSTSSQDYVRTGIGRFKREEHGKQHEIAAMLGYVQENDFDYWYGKVNSWIDALTSKPDKEIKWTVEDRIRKKQIAAIGEYQSTHSRIEKRPIILHHFWINLS